MLFPNARTVLLNLCLFPFLSLGSKYDLPIWVRKEYASLVSEYIYEHPNFDNIMVLLSGDDEELNHDILTKPILPKQFRNAHTVHATHRMDIDESIGELIKKFFA